MKKIQILITFVLVVIYLIVVDLFPILRNENIWYVHTVIGVILASLIWNGVYSK